MMSQSGRSGRHHSQVDLNDITARQTWTHLALVRDFSPTEAEFPKSHDSDIRVETWCLAVESLGNG